jgi:hypothetical protein
LDNFRGNELQRLEGPHPLTDKTSLLGPGVVTSRLGSARNSSLVAVALVVVSLGLAVVSSSDSHAGLQTLTMVVVTLAVVQVVASLWIAYSRIGVSRIRANYPSAIIIESRRLSETIASLSNAGLEVDLPTVFYVSVDARSLMVWRTGMARPTMALVADFSESRRLALGVAKMSLNGSIRLFHSPGSGSAIHSPTHWKTQQRVPWDGRFDPV